jgi:exodeoxyribonuclease VII large subunit
VAVSGPGAAEAVAGALSALDARRDVEVIVLARGGGNATELLPFSDESLCRAVAASRTPVVSSIGHERDRPLCDELADLRCATPSLAAQAVVPSRSELEAELARLRADGRRALVSAHERAAYRLAQVDLRQALGAGAERAEARLDMALARLRAVHPRARLAGAADRLAALRRELDALSPTRVLDRGYAVVRTADGTVVRRAAQVSTGERLTVGLAHGRLGARVEEVES